MADDFTLPDGTVKGVNLNNFDSAHREFAMHCMFRQLPLYYSFDIKVLQFMAFSILSGVCVFFIGMLADREKPGVGASLFTREFGRTASYYSNASFVPNFLREPKDFLPSNRSEDIERATELCGESYQCRYDYGMSLNRDMAYYTKSYYDQAVNIKATNDHRVTSCGVLETPRFGRKSTFSFTPGTDVAFECDQGFVLSGDPRRTCQNDGKWDPPTKGYTVCIRKLSFKINITSPPLVLSIIVC